jgi:very-short-patch-repair endonuclease
MLVRLANGAIARPKVFIYCTQCPLSGIHPRTFLVEKHRRMRGTTPEIERRAKELRSQLTLAEQVVWRMLRNYRQAGFYFRRQHPLGRFIVDFCCTKARLCVEIDGAIHAQQSERDAERTAWLEAMGYMVIRFSNEEVVHTPHLVAQKMKAVLASRARDPRQNQPRV